MNILIDGKLIKEYPGNIKELEKRKDLKVIDANKLVVVPGLIDIHVHLREPGFEHKENYKDRNPFGSGRWIYLYSLHAKY